VASNLDYSDRPSKRVSRRILVDVLRRLHRLDNLANYSYVGFGAYQFLDFDLVHRELGVRNMTSIESDSKLIARCHFNVPYKDIQIIQGTATTVLPTLDWTKKSIVWLDYTQRLRQQEIADCENVALTLTPGSVLAVTLNCHPGEEGTRMRALEDAIGTAHVAITLTDDKLGGWGLAAAQHKLLTAKIEKTLNDRGDGASWQQVLNIRYKDDARMQLIVGIIDHPDIHAELSACKFGDMDFTSYDAESLIIAIPSLTTREQLKINESLPSKSPKAFAGISQDAVSSYAKFYRLLESPL
jgi:hypothetical protein